jgi:hypothetical protein
MPLFKDLTGMVFNRWTVIERDITRNKHTYWKCRCSCGTLKSIESGSLIMGSSKSCSCLVADNNRDRLTTHGRTESVEYGIWCNIKVRCLNKNGQDFHNYKGRGITVCQEWIDSFEAFFNYIGERPTPYHSIDRINNDGNYCPGNVRWATKWEQANNTRVNRLLEFKGETNTLAEWGKIFNIKPGIIHKRLKRGWSMEDALTIKENETNIKTFPHRFIEYNGISKTLSEWAIYSGIQKNTLFERIKRGWPIEKALTTPVKQAKT